MDENQEDLECQEYRNWEEEAYANGWKPPKKKRHGCLITIIVLIVLYFLIFGRIIIFIA